MYAPQAPGSGLRLAYLRVAGAAAAATADVTVAAGRAAAGPRRIAGLGLRIAGLGLRPLAAVAAANPGLRWPELNLNFLQRSRRAAVAAVPACGRAAAAAPHCTGSPPPALRSANESPPASQPLPRLLLRLAIDSEPASESDGDVTSPPASRWHAGGPGPGPAAVTH